MCNDFQNALTVVMFGYCCPLYLLIVYYAAAGPSMCTSPRIMCACGSYMSTITIRRYQEITNKVIDN